MSVWQAVSCFLGIVIMSTENAITLTKTLMDQYRESLVNRGYGQQTISMYFCYLNRLYDFLPGEKKLTDENLAQWAASLKAEGLSDKTVRMHISAVNGLLRFCGQKSMPTAVVPASQEEELPELTRDEYLQLLTYIKEYGSERDYLLTKLLATIDMNLNDLPCVTAEACMAGTVELENNRKAVLPDGLKQELLAYLSEQEMTTGPVFVSRRGRELDRSNITRMIRRMGKNAGLNPEKCNPRALHNLYKRTQEEIDQMIMPVHMQAYNDLLNNEQEKENEYFSNKRRTEQ